MGIIDFMVVSAPRSGSTWVSNWLTTDTTLCIHEPLWHMSFEELDTIKSDKLLGISETGSTGFHKHLNSHPAKKVVLHRDLSECSESLVRLGFNPLTNYWVGALEKIHGKHYHWKDVFNREKAKEIYEYLLNKPFDQERWRYLKDIHMQPYFTGITFDKSKVTRLLKELRVT